jgi:hypothetical protein
MTPDRFEHLARAAMQEIVKIRCMNEHIAGRLSEAERALRDLLDLMAAPPALRVPDLDDESVATDPTYPRRRRVAAGIARDAPRDAAFVEAARNFQLREGAPDGDALRNDAAE